MNRKGVMKRTKSISDLGAAAYLLMHSYKVVGRKGRDIFFVIGDDENTDENFDRLTLDYLSSEFHRFDSCIMSLKKIGEYSFNDSHQFVTDLGAAAYILMHKYKVVGRRGKAIYFEADDETKFNELSLEYLTSDFHRFDSCLMSLKKISEYISERNLHC